MTTPGAVSKSPNFPLDRRALFHFPIAQRACQVREGVPESMLRPFQNKSLAVLRPRATKTFGASEFGGYTDSLVVIKSGFI